MEHLKPFFPESLGKPRIDDRRVLSGINVINRNGLRLCDAPKEYGLAKILYNRWKRWSDNGVFARSMVGLAAERDEQKTIMIPFRGLKANRCQATDATELKAHPLRGSTCKACVKRARRRTCAKKGGAGVRSGAPKAV